MLALPVAPTLSGPLDRIAGVVTAAGGFGAARAATIDVAVAGSVAAGAEGGARRLLRALDLAPARGARQRSSLTLALAVVSALVGGLILNLMPCVFPVLSLKVLGFATHHDTRPTMRDEAVAFGGRRRADVRRAWARCSAALRAAGEQLGWGFQLQSPAVVSALAILFFVLALNLSGVFEFGQLAPSGVASWTAKNRTLDAFGSGVLAVVVASPCTAPFMGAALGFALAGSGGVDAGRLRRARHRHGVALCPLRVVSGLAATPAASRVRGCSDSSRCWRFPLYATVIWLAWVLGAQRDNDALLRLLLALLGVGFALWAWRIVRTGGARPWGIAGIARPGGGPRSIAWPLFATEPVAPPRRRRPRQRERRARWLHVHAGHGGGAHRLRARRCSSTSPRRGA